jgi:hypothetical protein
MVANAEMEETVFLKSPGFKILCRILSEELLTKYRAEFDELETKHFKRDKQAIRHFLAW